MLTRVKDVNGDGFDDLMVQIEDEEGAFLPGDTVGPVTGTLLAEFGSLPVVGSDSVCLVP